MPPTACWCGCSRGARASRPPLCRRESGRDARAPGPKRERPADWHRWQESNLRGRGIGSRRSASELHRYWRLAPIGTCTWDRTTVSPATTERSAIELCRHACEDVIVERGDCGEKAWSRKEGSNLRLTRRMRPPLYRLSYSARGAGGGAARGCGAHQHGIDAAGTAVQNAANQQGSIRIRWLIP